MSDSCWCGAPADRLGLIRKQDGVIQADLFCLRGHRVGGVSRDSIERWEELPLVRDYLHDIRPCERCGSSEGSQLHHWAPWEIFEDANCWPCSWLCRRCHSEWHTKINRARRRSL